MNIERLLVALSACFFVLLSSCDKVCVPTTLNQLTIANFNTSEVNAISIRKYDTAGGFTKFIDSSNIPLTMASAAFDFSDKYDYVVAFYPVGRVCTVKNIYFPFTLGPGIKRAACYSSYSYEVNDSSVGDMGQEHAATATVYVKY